MGIARGSLGVLEGANGVLASARVCLVIERGTETPTDFAVQNVA